MLITGAQKVENALPCQKIQFPCPILHLVFVMINSETSGPFGDDALSDLQPAQRHVPGS
jgi:hypothetical protein